MINESENQFLWMPYDPTWLIALAKKQYPDKQWLVESLEKCVKARREPDKEKNAFMTYFIDIWSSSWDNHFGLPLNWPEGEVILHIMKDQSVGAVRLFISRPFTALDLEVVELFEQRETK